eukprot:CAMPEP_0196656952 /NCGR_PEP_ID=MMETSP1086-20130531/20603_1 /TAXON_ID=77921 /ORGANISM="Cyanoptyche  gloeocystis , Strain SAG4.97" /LENGTH=180 /DNA_ID=CAMNT_0041989885 /DNA_START=143 /DNA_END=685 /DNA_ORIENTATION=+
MITEYEFKVYGKMSVDTCTTEKDPVEFQGTLTVGENFLTLRGRKVDPLQIPLLRICNEKYQRPLFRVPCFTVSVALDGAANLTIKLYSKRSIVEVGFRILQALLGARRKYLAFSESCLRLRSSAFLNPITNEIYLADDVVQSSAVPKVSNDDIVRLEKQINSLRKRRDEEITYQRSVLAR